MHADAHARMDAPAHMPMMRLGAQQTVSAYAQTCTSAGFKAPPRVYAACIPACCMSVHANVHAMSHFVRVLQHRALMRVHPIPDSGQTRVWAAHEGPAPRACSMHDGMLHERACDDACERACEGTCAHGCASAQAIAARWRNTARARPGSAVFASRGCMPHASACECACARAC